MRDDNEAELALEAALGEVDRALEFARGPRSRPTRRRRSPTSRCPQCGARHGGAPGQLCPDCRTKAEGGPPWRWWCAVCRLWRNTGGTCARCGTPEPEGPSEADPELEVALRQVDLQAPAGSGCPVGAQRATDRCLHPGSQTCPPIPNLLCLRNVDGIPFEYPLAVGRAPATGLRVVTRRAPNRLQRFIPSVQRALRGFLASMRRFALPCEAILTAGSLYCRCVSNTNTLSNHSFGDAIDVVGVRWSRVGGPGGRLPETIVHNFRDPGERALLRRINACLRLSFATVIDYNYNAAHHDHFHCDMNRGRGRPATGRTTMVFVQEALATVLGRRLPQTGRWDQTTQRALAEFAGVTVEALRSRQRLNEVLNQLFLRVASGR
jgi:hypothetical protein